VKNYGTDGRNERKYNKPGYVVGRPRPVRQRMRPLWEIYAIYQDINS
jgi:hypothetical protein